MSATIAYLPTSVSFIQSYLQAQTNRFNFMPPGFIELIAHKELIANKVRGG
mgnify:CR=1